MNSKSLHFRMIKSKNLINQRYFQLKKIWDKLSIVVIKMRKIKIVIKILLGKRKWLLIEKQLNQLTCILVVINKRIWLKKYLLLKCLKILKMKFHNLFNKIILLIPINIKQLKMSQSAKIKLFNNNFVTRLFQRRLLKMKLVKSKTF